MPGESVEVIGLRWNSADAMSLAFARSSGEMSRVVLYRLDEARISPALSSSRPFDAPAQDFRLVAEAQRIRFAGLYDPMLAVATSDGR